MKSDNHPSWFDAIGLINRSHWQVDTELLVHAPTGVRPARIRSGFPGRQARSFLY